jgi:hypothetical protein
LPIERVIAEWHQQTCRRELRTGIGSGRAGNYHTAVSH